MRLSRAQISDYLTLSSGLDSMVVILLDMTCHVFLPRGRHWILANTAWKR